MFDSPADAQQALQAYFDPPRIEVVVEALVPAVVFEPIPGAHIAVGGTKFGGVPDLPPGTAWPRPPAPDDPEAIAQRANEATAKEIREHLARGLPYPFIAQIDLAEAAKLGPIASALPPDGRLLFFYDMAVGPWETGTRPARVIWDRSPRDALEPLEMPKDLAEAAEQHRKQMEEIVARFGKDKDETGEEGSIYDAPARAMRLKPTLRLPSPASLEMASLPDLYAVYRGEPRDEEAEEFREAYDEAVEEHHGTFPREAWRRQQLLGSPMPEQDDPRYDALIISDFGKQDLSREEWQQHRAKIHACARDWLVLLQIDLTDWMQARFGEGTVYFVIRGSDLKQRRFDRVVAVYQQT